ncbi:MAG: SLC13 family permease [Alphaproteobacteria bacterium]|nr:SLC13 family permease [Alphaproteobacteria bacterium]
MTFDQGLILGILVALLGLFIWGRFRYDLVALMGLLTATLLGLIEPKEAFSGFGNAATVTVALVLILSRALSASGAIDPIARLVQRGSGTTVGHIGGLSGTAALLSAFMNNVGALALLMPVAIQSARKSERPVRLLLMPLAFASILGGMLTLIGTPPNILISAIRGRSVGESFAMFDFFPVGGVVAVVGLIYLVLLGWRLIPSSSGKSNADQFGAEVYTAEVKLSKESKIYGKTITEIEAMSDDLDVVIAKLIRRSRNYPSPPRHEPLHATDHLILEGVAEEIDRFISDFGLTLSGGGPTPQEILKSGEAASMEMVVQQGSPLDGRTVAQMRFGPRYRVALLGVSRQGKPHRGRLKDFKFRPGDILLLQGAAEELDEAVARFGALPLRQRDLSLGRRGRGTTVLAFFAAAVLAAATGYVALPIAFGVAVVAIVLFGVVPLREVYDSVDWPVIVLLGALIPVGGAMESTGATGLIAVSLLSFAGDLPNWLILGIILVVTMTLSDVLNNAATTVVMAPIALAIANGMDQSPDSYLMAVAVGASCAFLTPIGHQNNALVMGPGGYRFSDYWRVGLPLEILIAVVAVPAIMFFWPV